ncbi:hypothetical protein N656DRAFT_265374 [Canariomyces notabilis]|uniref:Uncharacterized protein n=1 Tax=Canariomyces notabilis TaxID=2074819 RepID=A0AAN6TLK5_9PEZI|nr:hypothetical protein N656DRAFT_265374 [Canariomyces arenarius]
MPRTFAGLQSRENSDYVPSTDYKGSGAPMAELAACTDLPTRLPAVTMPSVCQVDTKLSTQDFSQWLSC